MPTHFQLAMAKVRAAYNYSYNYEGKKISFKKDEEFQLLTKSNKDWWQVRRWMEGSAQDIYVPAVYVKEVDEEVVIKKEEDPTYMNLSELNMKPPLPTSENGTVGGGSDLPSILTKPKKKSSIKRNASMEKDKEKPPEKSNSDSGVEGSAKTNGLNAARPVSPSMLRRLNQQVKPQGVGNSPLPPPQGGALPGTGSLKRGENLAPPPVQTKPRSKSTNVDIPAPVPVESNLDRNVSRQGSTPKGKVPPPVQTKPKPQKVTPNPRPVSCVAPGSEMEGVGRNILGENAEGGGIGGKPIVSALSSVLMKKNPHLAGEHKMLMKTSSSGVAESSSSRTAATSEGLSKSMDYRRMDSPTDSQQQNKVSNREFV